jgi:hypothetical protein
MGWAAGVITAYDYSPNPQTLKLKARRLNFSKTFGAYRDLIDAVETELAAENLKIATVMVCLIDGNADQDDASNLDFYGRFGTRTSQYSISSSTIRCRRRLICGENIDPLSW